jgi:hypothetical protein
MGLPNLRRDERKLQTVGRVTTAWGNDGVPPLKVQNSKPQANTVPSKSLAINY